jgi:hypothetical protein
MAKTLRAWEADPVQPFPPSASDIVPDDHRAQLVRDTMRNDLDRSSIVATDRA